MYSKSSQSYKNRYTRELSRLLLVYLPPKNGRAYGLTGNLLPIIVLVNSSRKFRKMRGWYWAEYSVTNRYAKLTERMKLHEVDEEIVKRLAYRVWTTDFPKYDFDEVIVRLSGSDANAHAVYVTVLDLERSEIFLFYMNFNRKNMLKDMIEKDEYRKEFRKIKLKRFEFYRFKKHIVNYVTTNSDITKYLF